MDVMNASKLILSVTLPWRQSAPDRRVHISGRISFRKLSCQCNLRRLHAKGWTVGTSHSYSPFRNAFSQNFSWVTSSEGVRGQPSSHGLLVLSEASQGLTSTDSEGGETLGIIIVDHGSRRAESNDLLNVFVDMFQSGTGRHIVEPAHMELAEPSISVAFDRCVARGASTVVISPYFLSPGRHWKEDIPALAAAAAEKHPGIKYLVTAPIGAHPLLVSVIDDRIRHCLAHSGGASGQCDVCSGRGSCKMQETLHPPEISEQHRAGARP